ncbi:uncharacterized protein LOC122650984 [Telopea speciosissima]|uniref:uncharacterized protein LOC122650984 n=1 Tax=Telopea speciosissima TaxID=54955 RepID=UPI001CC6316C|nr:uncharacterized protein LOC122650984 [Telopea speciosissima]
MDAVHEKSSLVDNTTDKVREERAKEKEKDYEEGFGNDGSACLQLFLCLRWQRCNKGKRVSLLQEQGENRDERLQWMRRLKKETKEITELLFVLNKRKNVIRKLIRSYANNNMRRKPQFQYDLQSYALNFDEGQGKDHEYCAPIHFSSRFAASLKRSSTS